MSTKTELKAMSADVADFFATHQYDRERPWQAIPALGEEAEEDRGEPSTPPTGSPPSLSKARSSFSFEPKVTRR